MKKHLAIAAVAAVLAAVIAPIDGCLWTDKDGNGPGACEMLDKHIKAIFGDPSKEPKWPGCARRARPWDYTTCIASRLGFKTEKGSIKSRAGTQFNRKILA